MRVFYDANGRPDLNGQYEMRDGQLSRRSSRVLQHGESVRFDIAFRDAASSSSVFLTDAPTQITDAQIAAFRDSAEGKEAIAYAKSAQALNGWRSGAWNDQMERQAIIDAFEPAQRGSPISPTAMADAKVKEDAAYQRSVAALNAHRR